MNAIQKALKMEYLATYKMYNEYFTELDSRGIAPFIWQAEPILAGFETNYKNPEMDKLLLNARARAMVTALLEHPAGKEFQKDMEWLVTLAKTKLPSSGKILSIDAIQRANRTLLVSSGIH